MYEIIDKILLFICCTTLYLIHEDYSFAIVPVIISVSLSCLFLYYDDVRIRFIGIIVFAIVCILVPTYIIFLPLLLYDILYTKYKYVIIVFPVLLMVNASSYFAIIISFTFAFFLTALLLKFKTDKFRSLQAEYNELRDSSMELSLLLEEKNQSLLQNQDYEINLATLNERNRISKEIHDNIGHLLSRALLQVGALLTVTKEDVTRDGLTGLKDSLSGGMDEIRNSIHRMYDESIDLYMQVEQLVKGFTYCQINMDYDIKLPPPLQLKHCMIGILKESLANIIRHSNATKVNLLLREHPAMYQLVIQDNGKIDEYKQKHLIKAFKKQEYGDGMGLHNIYDRVKGFDGNINISLDQGFKLFISIPKKTVKEM